MTRRPLPPIPEALHQFIGSSSRGKTHLVLSSILLALLAWLATEAWIAARPNLCQQGLWIPTKSSEQMGLNGRQEFRHLRQSVAGGVLNLGAWQGYNEVFFHRPLGISHLVVEFQVGKADALSVIYDRSPSGFKTIRLSGTMDLNSGAFEADADGLFREVGPSLGKLTPGKHRLELKLDNQHVRVKLDHRTRFALARKHIPEEPFFGLRAEGESVKVYKVQAWDAHRQALIPFSFDDRTEFYQIFSIASGLLLILVMSVARTPARQTAMLAYLLMLAAPLFVFDSYYFSRSYVPYDPHARLHRVAQALERLRTWVFQVDNRLGHFTCKNSRGVNSMLTEGWPLTGYQGETTQWMLDSKSAITRYEYLKPIAARELNNQHTRIAFIGSSQTWGAGAHHIGETWVGRVHQKLNSKAHPVEAWNLSMWGSNSDLLAQNYALQVDTVRPHIVLINLSHNDYAAGNDWFRANLLKIVRLNQARSIPTVLLLEAVIPSVQDHMRVKHQVMRELASQENLEVWDLHAFVMGHVRASGFLWWDRVHFTHTGHRLVGDWIAPKIAAALKRKAAPLIFPRQSLTSRLQTSATLQIHPN